MSERYGTVPNWIQHMGAEEADESYLHPPELAITPEYGETGRPAYEPGQGTVSGQGSSTIDDRVR
ncbi:TPA: hypothetical protein HA265_06380 [Candidatus Woesearchaeota archaeon]|nr:hypothetical protein [Candidatus Woesearchaeota archaeon]